MLRHQQLAAIRQMIFSSRPTALCALPVTMAGETKINFKPAISFKQITQAGVERIKNLALLLVPKKMSVATIGLCLALGLFGALVPIKIGSYLLELHSAGKNIAEQGTSAFQSLGTGALALFQGKIDVAEASSAEALHTFADVQNTLGKQHIVLQTMLSALPFVGSDWNGKKSLLAAGESIAFGNLYLTKGLNSAQNQAFSTPTERLTILLDHLTVALPHYQNALKKLATVDPSSLPKDVQGSFQKFRVLYTAGVSDLESSLELGHSLKEIFGGQGFRRYLLVFQNPDELRATGGFMGSFAVIELQDGHLVNLEVPPGGTYDVSGQLSKYLEPPAPLLLTNKRWEFQDANWFPDFKTSAEKILQFYRLSRGKSADGVFAINATVLKRVLKLTGPITDSSRSVTLEASNATQILQRIVETGPEKKNNKPKQILSDLAPVLLGRLTSRSTLDLLPVLTELSDALQKKEIQAYVNDPIAEGTLRSFGWAGAITQTRGNEDYLLVVDSNIQGQKTNAVLEQTISHQVDVDADGTLTDTVTITRSHSGQPGELWYGVPNISYLRVYVPAGSSLLSAQGFSWPSEENFRAPESWYEKDELLQKTEQLQDFDTESGTKITNEFGKTVFGNWALTNPGSTSTVQFTYRLPFKLGKKIEPGGSLAKWKTIFLPASFQTGYQLIVQNQSGSKNYFESQIILPPTWKISWSDGPGLERALNGAAISTQPLAKDTVWSLKLENQTMK